MGLFVSGRFNLHSGSVSQWKIECDALDKSDWATLALMVAESVPPFSSVVGVPRGGLALARALETWLSPAGPCLVVDDVLTTGNSILEVMAKETGPVIGYVIFARGKCPLGVSAMFQMHCARYGVSG